VVPLFVGNFAIRGHSGSFVRIESTICPSRTGEYQNNPNVQPNIVRSAMQPRATEGDGGQPKPHR
jgi:hypothetical protein